jgi:DNA polymerase-3 subunit delta
VAVYVFYGDDTFSSWEAFQELVDAMGSPELRESNLTEFEGAGLNAAQFAAVAQVMPFLAERRLVVVRGLMATAESKTQGRRRGRQPVRPQQTNPSDAIIAGLEGLPPTTDVVFLDGHLDPKKGNPVLAALKPLGNVRYFPLLRGDSLSRWVKERMEQKGGSITGEAISLMVEMVGSNLGSMDSELEKLAIYRIGTRVEADDVRTLVSAAREASIFALVDAILEHRADAAMNMWGNLLQSGLTNTFVISMVSRQARFLVLAQELGKQRVAPNEWGERLGIQQEFVLRKVTQQARQYSSSQLRQLYRLLLETDLSMKRGEATDEIAMVAFLAQTGTLGTPSRR